jgi:RES domain-containing protein
MAESVALAVLENLVHMPRQDFPAGYVVVAADVPDGLDIASEEEMRSRLGLSNAPPHEVGDRWFDESLSAGLRVGSVVIPGAYNYLFNPAHPEFRRIVAAVPVPFDFDPRLFG